MYLFVVRLICLLIISIARVLILIVLVQFFVVVVKMKTLSSHYGRLFQYIATLSGSFAVISAGINLGWTSPYLPKLLEKTSDIPITSEEGSWCAVMPLVGAPAGAFLAANLVDRLGRKKTVLLCVPFAMVSFLTIAFAKTILLISMARFLCGSVEGALYTALPIYISEISEPKVRGKLSATVSVAAIIGTLFINAIGPWTSIFTSSLVCLSIPTIHFLVFVWMPESPYYHIKKHNYEEAEISLKILRGRENVQEEMAQLCAAVKRQEGTNPAKFTDLITVPNIRRATLIYVTLIMTNKFSGKNPFHFYTSTIFGAAKTDISPDLAVIIYCTVEILATFLALVLIDRFGRRPLLIFSATGCAIALALEGLYFFLKEYHESLIENLGWWPVTTLIVYNVIFSLGLAFGPVLLLGELFPTNIKGLALCTADSFAIAMGTIASKFFQVTKDAYGMFVPFWSFSACCFFFLPFIVKVLPETKGQTLEDIQLYLLGEKKLRKN